MQVATFLKIGASPDEKPSPYPLPTGEGEDMSIRRRHNWGEGGFGNQGGNLSELGVEGRFDG